MDWGMVMETRFRVTITEIVADGEGGLEDGISSTFVVSEEQQPTIDRIIDVLRAESAALSAEAERRETKQRANALIGLMQAPDPIALVEVKPIIRDRRRPDQLKNLSDRQLAAHNVIRRAVYVIDHLLWAAGRFLRADDYRGLYANIAGATVTVETDSRSGDELVIRTALHSNCSVPDLRMDMSNLSGLPGPQ